MAVCGYNDLMGAGLMMLMDGMIEALEVKARYMPVLEVLRRELIELDAITSTLRTADGQTLPTMFVGLNCLARSVFERALREMTSSGNMDLRHHCRAIGQGFIELLAETEAYHVQLKKDADLSIQQTETTALRLAQWALAKSSDHDATLLDAGLAATTQPAI